MVKQFGMDEYEFAVREEKTYEVIEDVRDFRSEIGILYVNDFNRRVLDKLFAEYGLEFTPSFLCALCAVRNRFLRGEGNDTTPPLTPMEKCPLYKGFSASKA